MQKENSVPSAGTNADSEHNDQDMQPSSNDTKPNVVGLPSLPDFFVDGSIKCIATYTAPTLFALSQNE